jgi:hypothetical protein
MISQPRRVDGEGAGRCAGGAIQKAWAMELLWLSRGKDPRRGLYRPRRCDEQRQQRRPAK